jgi:hypothetical protein
MHIDEQIINIIIVSIGHRYPHSQLKYTGIFRQIKGHNSRTKKVVQSKIKLDLPFMVPDLVYQFQIIRLREN